MEHLFSPCDRLQDEFESQGLRFPGELRELNLDVSTEEFLIADRAVTHADLYAMLRNKDTVAWLTPHVAVAHTDGSVIQPWMCLDESCRLYAHADGEDIVALARSPEHLLVICDVVIRLLAASVVHSVVLNKWGYSRGALINAPTLAYLMEQCQSLKVLTLKDISLNEDLCHVLGAYSRSDLNIELRECKLTSAGSSALAEVLGRNQGPTKLDDCTMDTTVLADGLRGNSRLKSFKPHINQELLAIASALRENKGLVDLRLTLRRVTKPGTQSAILSRHTQLSRSYVSVRHSRMFHWPQQCASPGYRHSWIR
jgi:hypothetical protein